MQITQQQYKSMYEEASPNSNLFVDCLWAFGVGGGICAVGQWLCNLYQSVGLDKDTASTWVSITLIAATALLTACRVFDNLAKHAGAGTIVPITGFANSIVSPAMEFKSEGLVLGLGAKMFTVAGPVLVYGTTASVIYGLILYLFQ
ncbi:MULTISPECIES: stage V sporulation protein AC [Caproicibacterium]|jgi:stage V sporulation protein AC|uniref:Stage V sporulation protein AC n=1 Tax=Caproicibacterium lactatifermentans TaxID=2666138 RepID=A0A859DSW9_9FIRM|nr:stage V sporulation protein AC [Caproicibacterium lactatifermentans]ARP51030.1 stage V sporulation protein AC [Ruminococcaceae bacterium CPB6]QKN23243.1 stage V sporulation protein AC [Caproicibacterium lactatifermentans]QKO30075.1 stage V sporulation protein AC [Caproicibacterium lactatifermentans]